METSQTETKTPGSRRAWVMFLVMLLLTIPTLVRGKLSRVQGILLLLIYAAFCAVQFSL